MLFMTYKNPKELLSTLGVDIKAKDRNIVTIVIKATYVNEYFAMHKINKYTRLRLADELNLERTTLYNTSYSYDKLKLDKRYDKLFLAFKNKDKTLITGFLNDLKQSRKRAISEYEQKRRGLKPKKEKIIVEYPDKPPMSNLKLAEFLRKNKDFKNKAWSLSVCDISIDEWEQIKNINPIMFDVMKI